VPQPVVTPVVAETRWLLIKNPRFGEMLSEPQYVWVEADQVPVTMTTLKHGKSAIMASPEIVARYGPPPKERALTRHTEVGSESESAAPSPCLVDY